ncbi:MAG: phosphate ABC transporter permease subunit PstC [Gemmataceae bacterium]
MMTVPPITRIPTAGTRLANRLFRLASASASLLSIGIFTSAILYLSVQAWPAFREFGLAPLSGSTWDPEEKAFGLWPAIFGTVFSSIGAVILASILGIAAAVFVTQGFLPRKVAILLSNTIDLLAGVPSVIYGFWGLIVFAPLLKPFANWLGSTFGSTPFFSGSYESLGMLPAMLVLTAMVLPTISAVTRESLLAVPTMYRDGAIALGATKWEAIIKVILPAARNGIVGGITLGLGRALGETMALAMLVGNKHVASWSLLSPGTTLASLLALKFPEAEAGRETAMLMYAAIVLMGVTLSVNVIGVWLVNATVRRNAKGGAS